MGVDFVCGELSTGCSYTSWYNFRCSIIQSTYEYIEDQYAKDKELYGHLTENDEHWIGEGSLYYSYVSDLLKYKETLLNANLSSNYLMSDKVAKFNQLCRNYYYLNALNHFGLGGLFALCNQSDTEGYYTPGNSLDICMLLDRIKPFIKETTGTYDFVFTEEKSLDETRIIANPMYDVFEHSYKTLTNVKIC